MYKAMLRGYPINLLSSETIKKKSVLTSEPYKSEYKCPVCKEPVIIAWGTKRAPHFKHASHSHCIVSTGESEEHTLGKKRLFEYFNHLLKDKVNIIDIEHYIQETGQIADIYIEFRNGTRWTIEYQRSNISTEEIIHRRKQYKLAGIRDIWIVGENIIKQDSMILCSIKNVGQELISNQFGSPSLVSYNPFNDQMSIFRGLEQQNSRNYTVDTIYEYKLDDIAVNSWGEFFCFDDYLKKRIPKVNLNNVEVVMSGLKSCINLQKSEVPGYNFKFPIKDEENNIHFHHVNIPTPLIRFLPVELDNIVVTSDHIYDSISFNDDFTYLIVQDLYPDKWSPLVNKLGKQKNENFNLEDVPVTNAWLIEGLINIYNEKFQTAKEFKYELNIMETRTRLPHSTKMRWLSKHGLLKKEILKKDLHITLTIEKAILPILQLLNKNISEETAVKYALENKFLLPIEKEMPFNVLIFVNLVIRVKNTLTCSKDYSGTKYAGKGLWHDITTWE